jgi:hypothetical protein
MDGASASAHRHQARMGEPNITAIETLQHALAAWVSRSLQSEVLTGENRRLAEQPIGRQRRANLYRRIDVG